MTPEAISREFLQWVENRKGVSPIYEFIVGKLVADGQMVELICEFGDVDFIYNKFMAAVHYLLLEGAESELRSYYATVTERPNPISEETYLDFRNFCFQHRSEIRDLVASREVQINEVRRCAALLPSLTTIHQRHPSMSLALLDIGACAGLNLLFDQYHYNYGTAGSVGDPAGPVKIFCKPEGDKFPPMPVSFPSVKWRRGVDLAPVNAGDPHSVNWLIGMVSPDDGDRLNLLKSALELAHHTPPIVTKANAATATGDILAEIPTGLHPCVFHSFITQDFGTGELSRFWAALRAYGSAHKLDVISLEWERLDGQLQKQRPIPLKLVSFDCGAERHETLGIVDHRGGCGWIKWML